MISEASQCGPGSILSSVEMGEYVSTQTLILLLYRWKGLKRKLCKCIISVSLPAMLWYNIHYIFMEHNSGGWIL